jgi:AAA+ ATPase superfamily predicted ATPase
MPANPFKFGTVVDGDFFTNREEEIASLNSFLRSSNHLILSSPRRYGKTSLVSKVVRETSRPAIFLDLQLITSREDLAAQLLKRIYRLYPMEKMRQYILSFRIIPTVTINPVTGETDVSFFPDAQSNAPLEDVIELLEKVSTPRKKLIVVLDEFQEIIRIHEGLDKTLRSLMQHQKMINYVFLGSRESLIRDIFQKKNSPFYHFGQLMLLNKIPESRFREFLEAKFRITSPAFQKIASEILLFTEMHPYYTQQLAFTIWEILNTRGYDQEVMGMAIRQIIQNHDHDYERIWNTFNMTDMKVLIGITTSRQKPYSAGFSRFVGEGRHSAVQGSINRLSAAGILVKTESGYQLDDPFFRQWIHMKREQ